MNGVNLTAVSYFVRDHYKPWAEADADRLAEYFNWYDSLGILGVAYRRHEIAAVGTCRAFEDPADYRNEFVHRPWGKFVRCCLYGAVHPVFIPVVTWEIWQRHNKDIERIFLWHRDESELGPPKRYTEHQFRRLMSKLIRL